MRVGVGVGVGRGVSANRHAHSLESDGKVIDYYTVGGTSGKQSSQLYGGPCEEKDHIARSIF